MQLRETIMFIPKGETEVIKIEIYVSDTNSDGWWNVDNNTVLLSSSLYNEFRSCKKQSEQKKFFDQLRKVSSEMI